MTAKTISDDTREKILTTAWRLIAAQGKPDLGQAELARAAGVSRQTIFYAFGDRAGLLTAMVAYHDDTSAALARLASVAKEAPVTVEGLLTLISAWFDYLPEVYPVASLLDSASITDPDARAAIESRMVGRLLAGITARLEGMAAARTLHPARPPVRTAEAIWELVHFPAWRLLVVDRGWTQTEFRANRAQIIRLLVTSAPD